MSKPAAKTVVPRPVAEQPPDRGDGPPKRRPSNDFDVDAWEPTLLARLARGLSSRRR